MESLKIIILIILAYCIGSIPTALLYSKWTRGVDIRRLGDGNMGARNSKRQFGWQAGVLIALADILKGWLAVELAMILGAAQTGLYLCGIGAILGHDFPLFARLKGGQGFAVTTGVFLALFPELTLIGALIYFVVFMLTRVSDLAASLGMGFIAAATWREQGLGLGLAFIILVLLFIPIKKWLDRNRTAAFEKRQQHSN